jgi:hypothetical protein
MAAQQHISHDEAAKKFDDAQAKLKRVRDQAVQSAKDAPTRVPRRLRRHRLRLLAYCCSVRLQQRSADRLRSSAGSLLPIAR